MVYLIRRLILISLALLVFTGNTYAYTYSIQDRIKAFIIGKVAKYVTWPNSDSRTFKVTVIADKRFGELVKATYSSTKIKNKVVEVFIIDDLEELKETHVLFIPEASYSVLTEILEKIKGKGILTISDSRGFAEKNGIIQLYYSAQKTRLKINYEKSKFENLGISSSLLQIAQIVESKVTNESD